MQRTVNTEWAVKRTQSEALDQILGHAFPVLDHGFIRVVDYMGDDETVVRSAGVSYQKGTEKNSTTEGLINYLLKHEHTTPFEMCEITLHVKLPVFVARQWIRHRTSNVNEMSARYSILDREFYVPEPEDMAYQSKTNKQGRAGVLDEEDSAEIIGQMHELNSQAYDFYSLLLEEPTEVDGMKAGGYGLSRELARMNLPVNIYTQWYWKTDLHNLMRFMKLRADGHAQMEIRVYAEAIEKIVEQWVPKTFHAYKAYLKNAHKFSAHEMVLLGGMLDNEMGRIMIGAFKAQAAQHSVPDFSKREWNEFMAKIDQLVPPRPE